MSSREFSGLLTAENTEDAEKLSSADSLGPTICTDFLQSGKEEIETELPAFKRSESAEICAIELMRPAR
jgi:hypothetical protein